MLALLILAVHAGRLRLLAVLLARRHSRGQSLLALLILAVHAGHLRQLSILLVTVQLIELLILACCRRLRSGIHSSLRQRCSCQHGDAHSDTDDLFHGFHGFSFLSVSFFRRVFRPSLYIAKLILKKRGS